MPGEFRGGYRVTTPETMDVVRMVLVGQVQREVVGLVNAHGPHAVGLSGEDAHVFHRRAPRRRSSTASWSTSASSATSSRSSPASSSASSTTAASRSCRSVARGARRRGLQRQRRHRGRRARGRARRREARRAHRRRGALRRLAGERARSSAASRRTSSTELLPPCRAAWSRRWRPACGRCAGGVPGAHVLDGRVPHALLLEVFTDRRASGRWCCP